MRLISLRPFKYFSPLRFNKLNKKLRMPQSYRSPFKSGRYLRVSIPLTLMALTYAISQLSSKAYQYEQNQQTSFDDVIDLMSQQDQMVDEMIKIFVKKSESISLLLITLEKRLKQKSGQSQQILEKLKSELGQQFNKAQQNLSSLIGERYKLRQDFNKMDKSKQVDYEIIEDLFIKLLDNGEKLIPLLEQILQKSEQITEKLVDQRYFDPELIQKNSSTKTQ